MLGNKIVGYWIRIDPENQNNCSNDFLMIDEFGRLIHEFPSPEASSKRGLMKAWVKPIEDSLDGFSVSLNSKFENSWEIVIKCSNYNLIITQINGEKITFKSIDLKDVPVRFVDLVRNLVPKMV